MAVKASAPITLSLVVEVEAYYRYYLLQSSTLTKPSKPTTNPPSSSWDDTEPTYTAGSTNSLYFVDLTEFSDGTWSYSEVSLSSSYEAAKEAYNKAYNVENNLANNYYTKTETDAQITTTSDSIMLTVSETYATQLSVSDLEDDVVEVTGSLTTQINDTNTDLNALTDGYNTTAVLVSEHATKISSLEQTSLGWTMNFQTLEKAVYDLNENYVATVDEQYKYIRFIDGEIWIGKLPEEGGDDLQLVMRNDRISFLLNNTEVAYFSDDALHVTTVNVTESLRFGHFEFKERANGNMGLRWVGE